MGYTTVLGSAALLAGATTLVASAATGQWAAKAAQIETPFNVRESGGADRVVIMASFNGYEYPMMVHSNAEFTIQLRHDRAREFKVRQGARTGSYGIDRPGHVSGLGRHKGLVDRLTVGGNTYRNVPASIFEVPQSDIGMFGRGWIVENRLLVDLENKRVILSPTEAFLAATRKRLLSSGYFAVPVGGGSPKAPFTVNATINGVTMPMDVSTVGSAELDPAFAKAAKLKVSSATRTNSGPNGDQTAEYTVLSPVAVSLGNWTSRHHVTINVVDRYAYMGESRPQDSTAINGGTLGLRFLEAHKAVIDFGSNVLYLKS